MGHRAWIANDQVLSTFPVGVKEVGGSKVEALPATIIPGNFWVGWGLILSLQKFMGETARC
jgi:hypothetical protein